jgi:hypothetical protein
MSEDKKETEIQSLDDLLNETIPDSDKDNTERNGVNSKKLSKEEQNKAKCGGVSKNDVISSFNYDTWHSK